MVLNYEYIWRNLVFQVFMIGQRGSVYPPTMKLEPCDKTPPDKFFVLPNDPGIRWPAERSVKEGGRDRTWLRATTLNNVFVTSLMSQTAGQRNTPALSRVTFAYILYTTWEVYKNRVHSCALVRFVFWSNMFLLIRSCFDASTITYHILESWTLHEHVSNQDKQAGQLREETSSAYYKCYQTRAMFWCCKVFQWKPCLNFM